MSVNLTSAKQNTVEKSLEGHNFLITGKAGTGKSCVVSKIESSLRQSGKKVNVVCSTGKACDVYKTKPLAQYPRTVHSFLGIGTASAPFANLVERAVNNKDVSRNVKTADCIIYDECWMGSARLLELLHGILSECRENNRPFGGCQVRILK